MKHQPPAPRGRLRHRSSSIRRKRHLARGMGLVLLLLIGCLWSYAFAFSSRATSPPEPGSPSLQAPVTAQFETVELLAQGQQLYHAGQLLPAADSFEQAAHTFAIQKNFLGQAIALANLALVQQRLGQWQSASQLLAQSLQLLQQMASGQPLSPNQSRALAQILDIQGEWQLAQGQAAMALNTWQQTEKLYTELDDLAGILRSQLNQAQALKALGFYRRALTNLIRLHQTLQNQPNSQLKVVVTRSLGETLQVFGDLEQSQTVLQQSLTLAKQLNAAPDIAAAYLSLGNTVYALGNRVRDEQDIVATEEVTPLSCFHTPSAGRAVEFDRKAIEAYRQAALVTVSGSSAIRLQAQVNTLSLLVETQQWAEAKILGAEILSQLQESAPSPTLVDTRINFARSLICLHQATARDAFKDPFSWPTIAQVLGEAVQQARNIGNQQAEAYALGYLGGLYALTQQPNDAQDLTQQALLLAQNLKAPEISYRWQWQLGQLLKAQGDVVGAIAAYSQAVETLKVLSQDLVVVNPEVQLSFRDRVEPVYRQFVQLLLQPEREKELPSQEHLKQARETIEALQLAELVNFFREACLEAKPVLVDQVDQQAAVLYPIILANRLEIILSLPGQPLRHYSTQLNHQSLETALERLRQALNQSNSQEVLPLAQQLYRWLIQPAEVDLQQSGVKTLVFVLDGSLRNIPMAVLHNGKQYLVEQYSLALTPGLQLLKSRSLQRQSLRATVAGLTEARANFPPLSYVEQELSQIQTQVSGQKLLNQTFTSTNLQKALEISQPSIVHLATHGQFSSQMNDTFVLTWNDRINIQQLSQLLQSHNSNGNSEIDLLVLSACETATGDRRAALGLAGMAIRAGARSTLATLWSVNDAATATLIGEFYEELVGVTTTKAEALRHAQLSLLKHPQYHHPYYWASYVLVGNWL